MNPPAHLSVGPAAGRPAGSSGGFSAGPALLRLGATAVAAGRVALGVTALAWPSIPARPWVGAAADGPAGQVFGRALGGRDVALGLGALAALSGQAAGSESASAWVAAGALSDALDVAASLASWRELPRVTRWLVAASAGGAALLGAAGAAAIWQDGHAAGHVVLPDARHADRLELAGSVLVTDSCWPPDPGRSRPRAK